MLRPRTKAHGTSRYKNRHDLFVRGISRAGPGGAASVDSGTIELASAPGTAQPHGNIRAHGNAFPSRDLCWRGIASMWSSNNYCLLNRTFEDEPCDDIALKFVPVSVVYTCCERPMSVLSWLSGFSKSLSTIMTTHFVALADAQSRPKVCDADRSLVPNSSSAQAPCDSPA